MTWLAPAGFALAVLPVCLTPGVSFTLVTQRALDAGVRGGLGVVAGTVFGLVTHALLAGVGLAALVMSSAEAFTIVKLVGAAYLVVLGLRTLWDTRSAPQADRPAAPRNGRGAIVQGYLGNVLNPKAAAVYLTLAPQFLDSSRALFPQMMILCAAHVLVAVGWLVLWTGIVHVSRRSVRHPAFRTAMSRISGTVMIGLGVRAGLAAR